ncbi:MAG: single-stranded DNA-binding protein, partial [Kiritimatiellae bacterium]|nr:single-stranded DNA-binding protein [Kiritimatiellia bacterium]
MASLNKVFLIGNLTQDPDLRRIPAGTAVSTLRLAVNEAYLSKAGERVERTVYVDVDVWDRQAENCQQHLSKGSPVFIEGRLQMDQWEDRETHVKRSRLKVRADRVQFLGGRRGAAGAPITTL